MTSKAVGARWQLTGGMFRDRSRAVPVLSVTFSEERIRVESVPKQDQPARGTVTIAATGRQRLDAFEELIHQAMFLKSNVGDVFQIRLGERVGDVVRQKLTPGSIVAHGTDATHLSGIETDHLLISTHAWEAPTWGPPFEWQVCAGRALLEQALTVVGVAVQAGREPIRAMSARYERTLTPTNGWPPGVELLMLLRAAGTLLRQLGDEAAEPDELVARFIEARSAVESEYDKLVVERGFTCALWRPVAAL